MISPSPYEVLRAWSACSRCRVRASIQHFQLLRRRKGFGSSHSGRHASTVTSTTAINVPKQIPADAQKLHGALERLKKEAANYVNLSRLQLALRGLESERPTIRIAVLGLKSSRIARRLARLLLADPLSEEAPWERVLQGSTEDSNAGLLLRYGDEDTGSVSPSRLASSISIPTPLLRQNSIEIFVSSLNATGTSFNGEPPPSLRHAALVPTAETPKSFSGDVSFITFPVHRALVVAPGLEGCLTLGRFDLGQANEKMEALSDSVYVALDTTFKAGGGKDTRQERIQNITVVDIGRAEDALAKFRESKANASNYGIEWTDSGLPTLTEWFSRDSRLTQEAVLKPAVVDLIRDVIENASTSIASEATAAIREADRQALPAASSSARQPLSKALSLWSEVAHTELRDGLNSSFHGRSFAKLKWYKLLLRADDVHMILSEILTSSWLVQAEKGIIWLTGRCVEAGLYDESAEVAGQRDTMGRPLPKPDMRYDAKVATQEVAQRAPKASWPTQLSSTRQYLLDSTVPPLQALAQDLLVQTISISSLSVALSWLVYLSFSTPSLYTPGALAALGVIYALRRLQAKWEGAKDKWEEEITEAGRQALKDVESRARSMILREEVRQVAHVEGEQERQDAKKAVDEVKRALTEALGVTKTNTDSVR